MKLTASLHRNGKQLCDAKGTPQRAIEDQVLRNVQGLILRDEHVSELVELTNQELEGSLAEVESRVAALDNKLDDIDARLQRLYDAFETGKLDLDDLAPRIKELREKRDLVLRARSEARETFDAGRVEQVNRDVVLDCLKNLKGLLDLGTVGEKRAFLRSFIKSV